MNYCKKIMKLYKLHLQNLKADDGVINEAGVILTVFSSRYISWLARLVFPVFN